MLCSPVVSLHLYTMAKRAVQTVGRPLFGEMALQGANSVGTVLFDLAWRQSLCSGSRLASG